MSTPTVESFDVSKQASYLPPRQDSVPSVFNTRNIPPIASGPFNHIRVVHIQQTTDTLNLETENTPVVNTGSKDDQTDNLDESKDKQQTTLSLKATRTTPNQTFAKAIFIVGVFFAVLGLAGLSVCAAGLLQGVAGSATLIAGSGTAVAGVVLGSVGTVRYIINMKKIKTDQQAPTMSPVDETKEEEVVTKPENTLTPLSTAELGGLVRKLNRIKTLTQALEADEAIIVDSLNTLSPQNRSKDDKEKESAEAKLKSAKKRIGYFEHKPTKDGVYIDSEQRQKLITMQQELASLIARARQHGQL